MAYKVTENFLKKFGLNTLEDLPELPRYKVDENKQIVIDDLLEESSKDKEEQKKDEIEEEININKEES
ncbi:MAG: SMC-Scp complex subunit ScpB [Clostridia bacterium]|nr:SMC-Scp complex subunit ScpB [Clostridia bacterium]